MPKCVYNGGPEELILECKEECPMGKGPRERRRHPEVCESCSSKLLYTDPDFLSKWQDPLVIINRKRERTTALRGLLAGRSVFLMGGGPSANDLPLELLTTRGMWTMSVNNSCGHPRVRPQAMVCSDPPRKFTSSVWLDPAVMKFCPTPKVGGVRGKLRHKVNGEFVPLDITTADCPNVWGFQRHSWLYPDDRFFLADGACWGNHNVGVELTGEPKTVCTMLLGMRLLKYLGAGRIYLIGVDFRMTPDKGYSFGQGRTQEACNCNNNLYSIVNSWLCRMRECGAFDKFGLKVFNCYRGSGLSAFPYAPFEKAVEEARGIIETTPDLAGWYDVETEKK